MRRARRPPERGPLTLLLLVAVTLTAAAIGIGITALRNGPPPPTSPAQPTSVPREPATAPDDIVIANERLQLHLGRNDRRTGAVTVIDRRSGSVIGANLGQEIVLPEGASYRLPGDVQLAGEAEVRQGVPTAAGSGQELHLSLGSSDGLLLIDMYILLPDTGDTFFMQSSVRATGQEVAPENVLYFRMPAAGLGRFSAGEATLFLSDATTVLRRDLYSDGAFEEVIGLGSPVYVGGPGGGAIVLAWLDEPSRWPLFTLERRAPDLDLRFETGPMGRLADGTVFVDESGAAWSPRLLFDVADRDTRVAFEDYKRVMAALYPQPPLPDWLGPQWDSYWVYDLEINEENTLANAASIDTFFQDLGPWSIIFDAGWYVDSGLPGSAPDVVNEDKFPRGLRPVISSLKSRGIHSILYFSAPYLDSRIAIDPAGFSGPPAWMALSGFIDRYPGLVLSLTADGEGPSYIYNFLQPRMQEYMRYLMRLYLVEFGGDGILLDLVGEAGPSISDPGEDERAPGGRVPLVARQSLEVYESVWNAALTAKPEALVEGSWMNPALSRSFAQTWRYADEVPYFSFAYPYSGLVEHIDYAILQLQMLGMRPHIGYLRGPGTATQIQQWWMGAALALGAQFAIAVDFTELTPERAEVYRSYIAHYKPFAGFTFFGPGALSPYWFATSRDGVTYLGVLNRDEDPRDLSIPLKELGLANGRPVIAYEPEADAAEFVDDSLFVSLAPETFRFYVLRDTAGPVWGSRSITEGTDGGAATIEVGASPLESGGRVMVYAPASRLEVESAGYSIDSEDAQFQRVAFDSGDPARIRIVPIRP